MMLMLVSAALSYMQGSHEPLNPASAAEKLRVKVPLNAADAKAQRIAKAAAGAYSANKTAHAHLTSSSPSPEPSPSPSPSPEPSPEPSPVNETSYPPMGNSTSSASIEETNGTCFPSHATVFHADGRAAPVYSLRVGDRLLALQRDGTLGFDVVSRFSLADPAAKAEFVHLTTDAGAALELTESHHLPVGPSRALKLARDVSVGDTVWAVKADAPARLVPQRVAAIDVTFGAGLHSPVLKHGSMPIINGVATSSNHAAIVALASVAVPLLEPMCEATGTCAILLRAVATGFCVGTHLFSAQPVCNTLHHIDGTVASAPAALDVFTGLATLALTSTTAIGLAQARSGPK